MPDKPDITSPTTPIFDPTIQTENIAFAAAELTSCSACGRQNPPTRAKCLYCGRELEIQAEVLIGMESLIRPMESWERGFNVIFQKKKAGSNLSFRDIASLISQSTEDIENLIASDAIVPVARVESIKDAEALALRLEALGMICRIVSDDALAADQPPVRLAGIEIEDKSINFIAFFTHAVTRVPISDLALIVAGFLSQSRIDLVEKRQRKGTEIFDEVESSVHDTIVDVYSTNDSRGFRIQLAGFDFSCLGAEKGFLAAENIKKLVGLLAEVAPNATLVDDYGSVKRILGHVWEIERRSEPQGMRRVGLGKTGLQKVETTSNLNQFTKYSRLQWLLYEQEGTSEQVKETTVYT